MNKYLEKIAIAPGYVVHGERLADTLRKASKSKLGIRGKLADGIDAANMARIQKGLTTQHERALMRDSIGQMMRKGVAEYQDEVQRIRNWN